MFLMVVCDFLNHIFNLVEIYSYQSKDDVEQFNKVRRFEKDFDIFRCLSGIY